MAISFGEEWMLLLLALFITCDRFREYHLFMFIHQGGQPPLIGQQLSDIKSFTFSVKGN
jgi:hypothetical protein